MEGEEEDSDDPAALNNQGFWAKLLIFAAVLVNTIIITASGAYNVYKEQKNEQQG